MSADATAILTAVEQALSDLYPDVPVRVAKRRATGRAMQAGWQPGFPATCFVLSCQDAEDVDRAPSFEHVSVGYRVLVEYVKPAQAAVPAPATGGAATVVEDPDVRDKRQALRRALYRPALAGVASVFNARINPQPAYEQAADGGAVLLVSGEQFVYSVMEPRAAP